MTDLCANNSLVLSNSKWNEKHQKLTETIGRVLEDFSLIKFVPLNIRDEESLAHILLMVDNCIQFGEDKYYFFCFINEKISNGSVIQLFLFKGC